MTLTIALFAAGVVLVAIGLYPRRRGTDPHCRRCGFCLVGLESQPTCPECGADLKRKHAIQAGVGRRFWWAWVAGALALASSLGLFARSMTTPGWEHRAPGWWLAEVETRFATGPRFSKVYMGLWFGRGNGRVSQSTYNRATVVAFHRLALELTQTSTPVSNLLEQLAVDAANNRLVPDVDVLQVIRKSARPEAPPSTGPNVNLGDSRPLMIRSSFLPTGWLVRYTMTLESQSPEPITLCRGNGTLTRGSGNSSVSWEYLAKPASTARCTWLLEVWHGDADTPATTWTESQDLTINGAP